MKEIDPRQLAFAVLRRVEGGAYADLALDAALSQAPGLDPRDRGLATELVYGILRHQGRLDFALTAFCRKPLPKVERDIRLLLRLGAYQVLQLGKVPDSAAVNETVELARRAGLGRATGFINGILRALIRGRDDIDWPQPADAPQAHLEQTLSLPAWLAQRWLAELGAEEAIGLAEAMLRPAPFTLRVNTLRIDRETFLERLEAAGHDAVPTRYAPEGVTIVRRGREALPGSAEGWFQVQDEASMLVSHLLAPRPGERLLDACAAPGGKTTHIAALTGNEASVLAFDLHPRRVRLIAEGAERLGCRGIEPLCRDLTRPADLSEAGTFDRILLDAPCSGLGVLRRNPETRWRRQPRDIREMAELQRSMLEAVAPLLRPGGVLLYSLCTLTPEETEGVADTFLHDHAGFRMEDLRPLYPAWSELLDSRGMLRTYPHRHRDMDAFFAIRLKKD